MNRISTAGNYQSALLNLMSAQKQEADAQSRVSTYKNATDMAGFGRAAESLTTLKGAQSRVQGFLDTGEALADKLASQDLALNQVGDAITLARGAIGDALAADSVSVLMLEIQTQFQSIQSGLNAQYQGNYLFAGADTANAPVQVDTLAELTAQPAVTDVLGDDTLAPVSRLGEGTMIETGYLASSFTFTEPGSGTESHIFQIFKDIQAYNDDPATGPLAGKPTAAQKAFLTEQMSRLQAASGNVIGVIARNGSVAKQVETTNAGHEAQVLQLDEMVHAKTDADMTKAVTDLKLSGIAVQASAQIISQLSQTSLLNYLR